jgi:hypothetical protein
MREWMLVLIPAVLVIYFVVFPDQFHWLVYWLAGFIR